MSILMKLGITGWFSGLVFMIVACFFGLAGLELIATYIVPVGCVLLALGGICAFIEFIRFIWAQ